MTHIEYRTERISTDGKGLSAVAEELAKLGAEGWQVAATERQAGWTPGTSAVTVLLQRPASDTESGRGAVRAA